MINARAVFRRALRGTAACALVMMSMVFCLTAYAMTASISFSDPQAANGEEVTVAMHVVSTSGEPLGSASIMLNYDASALEFVRGDNAEGGAGSLRVTGQTTTEATDWMYGITFRALKEGSSTISISTAEVYDRDQRLADLAHSGSSTVTVGGAAAETTAAAAERLSSLQITPGTLSPAFSPDVTSYTAVVGDEVTRIAVSAAPENGDLKVSVSGNEELALGENTITVNLSTADGAPAGSYTIVVTKQEGSTPTAAAAEGDGTVTIGDTSYEIAETFDETLLPQGYTAESYSIGGKNVLSGVGKNSALRVMYLLSGSGSGDLFMYDTESGTWGPFVEVSTGSRTVTAVPFAEGTPVPAGLMESRLNLNGRPVNGWVGEKDQGAGYCVFYGMNADGETGFYRFDLKERTIQRYFDESPDDEAGEAEGMTREELEAENGKLRSRNRVLTFLAAAAAIIALAAAGALLFGRRRDDDGPEDGPEDGEDLADDGENLTEDEGFAGTDTGANAGGDAPEYDAEEDGGFADDVEDMDIHAEDSVPEEEPEEFPDEELYLPGNSPKTPADDDDDLFEDIEL